MKAQFIERLKKLRSETFDIANEMALAKPGCPAGELHESSNRIMRAIKMLEEGVTVEDEARQLQEWCDKQVFPVPMEQRAQLLKLRLDDKS